MSGQLKVKCCGKWREWRSLICRWVAILVRHDTTSELISIISPQQNRAETRPVPDPTMIDLAQANHAQ